MPKFDQHELPMRRRPPPNTSSLSRVRPMRHRHALYLSEAMTQRLQIMAETHRVAKSEILERALKRYVVNESGDQPADLVILQQESNSRSLRRLERDLAIATELIATFVRYFVTITPPLPGSEHAAARVLGQLRFDQVIEDMARRLRTDRSLIARVAAILSETPQDTNADGQQPDTEHAPSPIDAVPRAPSTDRRGK